MRSLRWVGLVFSLLIVGVLGGLMAPLSSGAATPPSVVSVTMKVNNGTAVNILGTSRTCDSSAQNWCYNILQTSAQGTNAQGKTRKVSILPISGSNVPRLLIADFINSNQKWFNGFILDPLVDSTTLGSGWTNLEANTVVFTITIRYDSCGNFGQTTTCTSNKDSVGDRTLAHASTGQFIAKSCVIPICTGGTNYIKDSKAELSAIVNLGPANSNYIVYNSAQDPVPTDTNQSIKPFIYQEGLNTTIGNTNSRQSASTPSPPGYPHGDCRESSSASTCAPTWTYTHRYNTFGPDQLRDPDTSLDLLTDICFKPQGPPTNNPNNPCKNKKYQNQKADVIITDILDQTTTFYIQEGQNAGYPLGQACAIDDPNCRCGGPQCAGTYKLYLVVTPDNDPPQSWSVKASGPGLGTVDNPLIFSVTPVYQTVVFPDGKTQTGWFGTPDAATAALLSNIPSFGGQWRFDINAFPGSPDGGKHIWTLDSINGTSQLYGTLASDGGSVTSDSFTFWNEPSGCNKTGQDLFALQGKDVQWNVWHGHLTSPNPNNCN